MIINRKIRTTCLAVAASTGLAFGHGGDHPTGLDLVEDAPLQVLLFQVTGPGVEAITDQDPLKPQEYRIYNDADPGKWPKASVRIDFALMAGHYSTYSDYIATIRIGSEVKTYGVRDMPQVFTIDPLIHGWSGTVMVHLQHTGCDFEMKADAEWNLIPPRCLPCQNLTCPLTAWIGSAAVDIPVAPVSYGRQSVALAYRADTIANDGPAILALRGRNGSDFATVERVDGTIRTVTCSGHVARVIDAPTTADPNRFEIRVSSDAIDLDGSVFRQTWIENSPTDDGSELLLITETVAGRTATRQFSQPDPDTWVLVENGRRRTTRSTLTETESTRIRRWLVEELNAAGSWVTVAHREYEEHRYSWAWETIRETIDPDGTAVTTTRNYYDAPDFTGPNDDISGRGLVKEARFPNGLVRTHEYHDADPEDPFLERVEITREAFADGTASRELRRYVSRTSVTLHERLETWVAGHQVSRREVEVNSTPNQGWRNESVWTGPGGDPEITHFQHNSKGWTTTFPDGTIEKVVESEHEGQLTRSVFRGTPSPISYGIPVNTGSEERITLNRLGQRTQWAKARILNRVSTTLEEGVVAETDLLGRPTAIDVYHGGSGDPTYREQIEYGCCGIARRVDSHGSSTHTYYDDLARIRKIQRNGMATETIYDGLRTQIHRYPATVATSASFATADNLVSAVERDLAFLGFTTTTRSPADGSLVESTLVTEFGPAEAPGTTTTLTLPAVADDQGVPATIIDEEYPDGLPRRRSGSLVVEEQLSYGADANGLYSSTSLVNAAANSCETRSVHFDWRGRPVSTVFAGDADGNGSPDRTTIEYDPGGRPLRIIDPDAVTSLFSYDLETESYRTAIDIDRDGAIDPAVDEVRYHRSFLTTDDAGTLIERQESGFIGDDGGETALTRVDQSTDGLQASIDEFPNAERPPITRNTTLVADPPGSWNTRITLPDGGSVVERFRNGRLSESEWFDNDGQSLRTRSYSRDTWQRVNSIVDSTGPESTLSRVSSLVDHVSRQATGGFVVDFEYDHRGRITAVDLPDTVAADGSPVANRRLTSYWPHGGIRELSGTPGLPVAMTWDHAHRLATLSSSGTIPATTRWDYDPDRGWLVGKTHDSSGTPRSGPQYHYTPAGRLLTRTNARGQTSSWTYGSDGRLDSVNHSDGTPGVAITERDVLGRPTRINDAGGPSAIRYSATGDIIAVDHQAGHLLAGWSTGTPRDGLGRLAGLALSQDGQSHDSQSFRYDSAGRLGEVESPQLGAFYDYDAGSRRIRQIATLDRFGPALYQNRSHDDIGHPTRLTAHDGNLGPGFITHADHKLERDPLGRISGNELADDTRWSFSYHPSGALAAADRARGADVLPGHRFRWSFDDNANLLSSSRSGPIPEPSTWTPDALDQHSSISRPNRIDIFGQAPPATVVEVNGQTATRTGPFFHHTLTSPDPGAPANINVTVDAGDDQQSGTILVPPCQTTPNHDPDGNLLEDDIFSYSWDAENRLTQAETTTAAVAAGIPYARIAYTYDGNSRLLRRERFDAPDATSPADSTSYLHAAWRCLGELDHSGQLVRSYAWGADAQGKLHLGDPNGALLWLTDHPTGTRHLAHADPHGNIAGLVESPARKPSARYNYAPFGETLRSTGDYAKSNPFRFSSHFTDPDTGLIHYGHRWLHPAHQRWMSREPLGELESQNLYAFVGNDPVNGYDVLGQQGFLATAGAVVGDAVSTVTSAANDHVVPIVTAISAAVTTACIWGESPTMAAGNAMWAEWVLEQAAAREAAKLAAAGVAGVFLVEECPENIAYNLAVQNAGADDQRNWNSRPVGEYAAAAAGGVLGSGLGGLVGKAGGRISGPLRRSATSKTTPGQFDGVRQLSQTLRDAGVPRADRVDLINSFREGSIVARQATGNENLLRFFGGDAEELGRFLTSNFPQGNARTLLALPPNNTATGLIQYNLRQGAIFFEGTVAPNFGKPGGGVQIFVPNLNDLVNP